MSQKYEKLKTLLKELFQLDQPDLDFGLYRIMHAKSAEVTPLTKLQTSDFSGSSLGQPPMRQSHPGYVKVLDIP
jgi:hypothetical protein